MKLFSSSFILILITFTSCDIEVGNPLGRSDGPAIVDFTRMVIVQTEDSIRCTGARLALGTNFLDIPYSADSEGKIPIATHWYENYDEKSKSYTVFRDSTDTHVWQDSIKLYRGTAYKEFYITFPNF